MIKSFKSYLKSKKGMTLVELLTAMTILTLMIFLFAPLMLSYLETVNVSGNKMTQIQEESGILQVLLGGGVAKDGYTVPVNNVPMSLTSPAANVGGSSVPAATITSNVKAYGLSSRGTEPDEDGNINIGNGYTTITTDELGSGSGIRLFPSSLTDDFQKAYITIYGNGINFTLNDCELSATGLTSEIPLTKGVDYDLEYHPDADASETNMLLLTVYGGGDKVSFETSPLLFKHSGNIYEIQVDAPMMIMVGEKSLVADDDGNQYHYYVSRGEIDDDGDLLIHRRVMNTTDDENDSTVSASNPIKLTSAMNDVEWVPAESASADNGSASSDDTYGYYVMCGDEGQVRRFWKRPNSSITTEEGTTVEVDGNYYWGGDYTYYTDYDFVQVNASDGSSINSTDKNGNAYEGKVYSTDTSFKFIAQRDATNTQSGFNVGSKEYSVAGVNTSTALLRSLSVVSVTRADDGEFYGRDGEVYFYKLKKNSSSTYPTVTEARARSSFSGVSPNEWVNTICDYAHGWLETKDNSYFEVNGVDTSTVNTDSYPITLTSVDAIRITSPNKTDVTNDGSYYFVSAGDGDTIAENATTNMNYPQENYTLYCGYIPAMMDLFASRTASVGGSYKYPTVWEGTYGHSDGTDGTFYEIPTATGLTRAGNRKTLQDNAHLYTYWRMTLGVAPYLTSGSDLTIDTTKQGNLAFYRKYTSWFTNYYDYLVHYPYTNLQYCITGKFYDQETYTNHRDKVDALFTNFANDNYTLASPNILINTTDGAQQNVTNGEVVDITISYLSHPFAIAVAANPTDDLTYDQSNDKDSGQVFYWNNRRETITFLDSATTDIPSGENDISVSLMVGYLLGGTVEYGASADNTFVNVGSVMNNGIVFLRAGNYEVGKQNSANGQTYEYYAKDSDGYKLAAESNVFHQFYYLNSRTDSGFHGEDWAEPSKGNHIGNLYGAEYWQNNRHIQYRSLKGGTTADNSTASSNFEYLRSHPMSNTKVNCVAWGTTWNGFPEAMWGTENGTVLSWWVNTGIMGSDHSSNDWNDRSVDAEIQSYKWIDNCNNVTFALTSSQYKDSVGSAVWGTTSTAGTPFSPGSDNYKYFYDKGTQATNAWGSIGFINTLESINDIEYGDDLWIAAGDQSDKNPADYSAGGTLGLGNQTEGTYRNLKAFLDKDGDGRGGSWINVRYWVDIECTGKHSDSNSTYHWTAVQISENPNYNIVQINQVNGMWIATGYIDGSNGGTLNDEYDDGEKTVICWTYDPLTPCGTEGGWSENVKMYDGTEEKPLTEMGGINSVAARD